MSLTLPILPATLPQGFCPADYQEMWNGFASHGSVVVPSGALGIQVSATVPGPDDQDRPWLQLDAFGRPIRLYWFAQGSWLSYHPLQPGSTVWWFDTLPDLDTFDGGDNTGVIGDTTGHMWDQALLPDGTMIAAQFPLVAGTLPSGTVLAAGDVGGEEDHSLLITEIPEHLHSISAKINLDINVGSRTLAGSGAEFTDSFDSGKTGSNPVVAHNNMPPFAVGYLLQRTARLYYSVT